MAAFRSEVCSDPALLDHNPGVLVRVLSALRRHHDEAADEEMAEGVDVEGVTVVECGVI